jgi:ABC-type multidrug transport system fused ATPase/permease subunit
MAVTSEILATYRGPGRVMARLMSDGPREDRALAILLGACVVMFIARWPSISREAFLAGEEPQARMAGALMGVVFILPLLSYVVALLSQGVIRLFGRKATGYSTRVALFWALLAASPLTLLAGLVAGFIGQGVELTITGALWFAVFLWFWIAGLKQAGWGEAR